MCGWWVFFNTTCYFKTCFHGSTTLHLEPMEKCQKVSVYDTNQQRRKWFEFDKAVFLKSHAPFWGNQNKQQIYPIGSMGLVYLPTIG